MRRQNVQILPLQEENNVYFETLGEAHLQVGRVRLSTSISWNHIQADKLMLNNIKGNMSELHDYYNLEGILLEQINTEANEALSCINTLATMPPSKRTKRYLFGKTLQFLFEVNEEAYEDIEILSKNDQWLVKNQQRVYQVVAQSEKNDGC